MDRFDHPQKRQADDCHRQNTIDPFQDFAHRFIFFIDIVSILAQNGDRGQRDKKGFAKARNLL